MQVTNGIKHNLKAGQIVWTVTDSNVGYTRIFKVKNITSKRIVCIEVGCLTAKKGLVIYKGANPSNSLHSPENLMEVEAHLKPTYQ